VLTLERTGRSGRRKVLLALAVVAAASPAVFGLVAASSAAPADDCAAVRDQVRLNELRLSAAAAATGLTSAQRQELANERALDAAALRACPAGTPTPTQTSATPSPTATATPTAAPPSTPPATPPAARACPPLPAFPNAACTGNVTPEADLRVVAGDLVVSAAGTRVERTLVTGQLVVNAPNVVVADSVVYRGITNCCAAGASFSVSDTTVGPPSGCDTGQAVGVSHYSATRVRVRNFGDGFRDSGDDISVVDSLVQTCAPAGSGAHSDGMQAYEGGLNVTISHSTLDLRADDLCCLTAALFSANSSRGWTMRDNLVAGGGYSVQLEDTDFGGTFVVTGNRIAAGAWQYGPNLVRPDCAHVTWVDNRLVTVGSDYQVTGTGAVVGCP